MKKYIVQYVRNDGTRDLIMIRKAKNESDLERELQCELGEDLEESKRFS